MSNFDSKYQLYCSKRTSEARDITLASDLIKAVKSIVFDDNLWNVSWRGNTFSVRPFLCSAMSFLHIDDLFDILCAYSIYHSDNFYDELADMQEEDYYNKFTEDENDMFNSILYQLNSQVPCVTRYLVGLDDRDITRKLIMFFLKEFTAVYERTDTYVIFKDKDLCNTEAFSYYISMYWALQKSKKLQLLLIKEIKIADIASKLDILCPLESAHYKCLSGEISYRELNHEYCREDTGIICRELFNLFSSRIDKCADDFDKKFMTDVCEGLSFNFGFESFLRVMACSYITMGSYDKNRSAIADLQLRLEDLEKSKDTLYKDNKELKSTIKTLTKERNKLSSKVSSLIDKCDSSNHDAKVSELESIISDLRHQVSILENEVKCKDNEVSKCKKTIRSQIKDIKSLSARLDECEVPKVDLVEDLDDDIIEVSVEEMAEKLKGYKIGVFGGFDAGCLVEKFKDYGISIKHVISDITFDTGDLDCAVILTTNIQHKIVRRLKSQYDGNFVYVNGTNIETMISRIYEKLVLEETV